MMVQPFVTVNYDFSCQSKEEVYAWIGRQEGRTRLQSEAIEKKFMQRESVGSIQIAPAVVLPHLEWDALAASRIYFIHLRTALHPWSDQIDEVKVVIAVLVKINETQIVKQSIVSLMRNLANDTIANQLRTANTKEAFMLTAQKLCSKN